MKKLLYIIFLTLSAFELSAQDATGKMKLNYNGFVGNDSTKNYIVIEVPNKKKGELYTSSLTYLNSIYSNPQKVLSFVENESITINGLTESIKGSLSWYKYQLHYNITIQFKDGKLKFEPSVTNLIEIWSNKEERKIYVLNTDSPDPVEINCIWMTGKNSQFVFKEDLKLSLENWINNYLSSFINGITKTEW